MLPPHRLRLVPIRPIHLDLSTFDRIAFSVIICGVVLELEDTAIIPGHVCASRLATVEYVSNRRQARYLVTQDVE